MEGRRKCKILSKKDWYDIKASSALSTRNIGKTLVSRTQGTKKCGLAWKLGNLMTRSFFGVIFGLSFALLVFCCGLLRWNEMRYRKKALSPGTMGWLVFGETTEFLKQGPDFMKNQRARSNKRHITVSKVKSNNSMQYKWKTYKEVYDNAIKTGSTIRERGVNPGDRCGIYGSNCPEWVIVIEHEAVKEVPAQR